MPFGAMFGALFFGGVCLLVAAGLIGQPGLAGRGAGACLAILGSTLAFGLVTRRPWARWGGVGCALVLCGLALRQSADRTSIADYVVLLAALATAILLAVPATGKAAPGASATTRRRLGIAAPLAALSFVGFLAVAVGAGGGAPRSAPRAAGEAALPASALAKRVRWADFASGMEQARQTGKPVLATFVTSWCPYCTKMRNDTWKADAVIERVAATVPVRVDVDGEADGPALGERFDIQGFPVQILLAPDGSVLGRADGYQSPRQLLDWLDDSLARYRAPQPPSLATAHAQ